MQGFILKGFRDYASRRFGTDVVNGVFEGSSVGGDRRLAAWDYVGPDEFSSVIERLAQQTGTTRSDLLIRFGEVMFQTLINLPLRQQRCLTLFRYLESIETGFCQELDELVPRLEFPGLACCRLGETTLEMVYASPLQLGDLAEGLIRGSILHFAEPVTLERFDDAADPARVRFVLTRE